MAYVRQNPAIYPAGVAPGFDPTHPAAKNARLSIVGATNVLTGKVGTITSQSFGISAYIGPGLVQSTGNSYVSFSGFPTAADQNVTLATILTPTSFADNGFGNSIIVGTGSNGGWQLKITHGTHNLGGGIPGIADLTDSGITLATNTPYFLAFTVSSAAVVYVVANLMTGAVQTSSVSSLSPTGPNGTFLLGSDSANDGLQGGTIAAAMYSSVALSQPQLLAWAQSPWSFWYPRAKSRFLVGAVAGAARGLFYNSPLTGLGAGGSFFPDRLAS